MGAGAAKHLQSDKAEHAAALLSVVQAFEDDEGINDSGSVGDLELFKRRIIRAADDSKKQGADVSDALAHLNDQDIQALSQYYSENRGGSNSPKKKLQTSPGLRIEEFLEVDDSPKQKDAVDDMVSLYSDDDDDLLDLQISHKPVVAFQSRSLVSPIKMAPDDLEIQNLDGNTHETDVESIDALNSQTRKDLSDDEKETSSAIKIYPMASSSVVEGTLQEPGFKSSSEMHNSPASALLSPNSRGKHLSSSSHTNSEAALFTIHEKSPSPSHIPAVDSSSRSSHSRSKVLPTTSSPGTEYRAKASASKIPVYHPQSMSEGPMRSPTGYYPDMGELIDMRSEKLMELQRTKVWSYAQNAQLERDVELLQKQLEQMDALDRSESQADLRRAPRGSTGSSANAAYQSPPNQQKQTTTRSSPSHSLSSSNRTHGYGNRAYTQQQSLQSYNSSDDESDGEVQLGGQLHTGQSRHRILSNRTTYPQGQDSSADRAPRHNSRHSRAESSSSYALTEQSSTSEYNPTSLAGQGSGGMADPSSSSSLSSLSSHRRRVGGRSASSFGQPTPGASPRPNHEMLAIPLESISEGDQGGQGGLVVGNQSSMTSRDEYGGRVGGGGRRGGGGGAGEAEADSPRRTGRVQRVSRLGRVAAAPRSNDKESPQHQHQHQPKDGSDTENHAAGQSSARKGATGERSGERPNLGVDLSLTPRRGQQKQQQQLLQVEQQRGPKSPREQQGSSAAVGVGRRAGAGPARLKEVAGSESEGRDRKILGGAEGAVRMADDSQQHQLNREQSKSLLKNLNRRRRNTVDGPMDEQAKAGSGLEEAGLGAGDGAGPSAGPTGGGAAASEKQVKTRNSVIRRSMSSAIGDQKEQQQQQQSLQEDEEQEAAEGKPRRAVGVGLRRLGGAASQRRLGAKPSGGGGQGGQGGQGGHGEGESETKSGRPSGPWSDELDGMWAEVSLLLRKPIESEADMLYTIAAAEAGLIFADQLNEVAKSLNVLRGALSRWLLPYDNNTRIDEQCSTPHSVVESMPDALRGRLTERQVHYLVAGVNSVRKLVRVKIADDNDLEQARRAVKTAVDFFKQLQEASAQQGNMSAYDLLQKGRHGL